MTMRIDHYHHLSPGCEVYARLDVIDRKLDLILQNQGFIMSLETDALDALEANTAAINGAGESAEKAFTDLAALIATLKTNTTDPATAARINAVSTALADRAARLSAAVVAAPTA